MTASINKMKKNDLAQRAVCSLLLISFLLLTINLLLPPRIRIPFWLLSPNLTKKETVISDGLRVDFVRKEGKITLALDKNYATVLKTLDKDGNCILEKYFDENGNPVVTADGYSAIRSEYDKYGHLVKKEYLDRGMNLTAWNQGYATVLYTYNESDQVETELYFDQNMQPAKSTSKRYGVRHEYGADGKESVVMNLDADGNLISGTNEYVIVKKTYTPGGKLHTVMYYDENENPFKLSNGAYGYLYENGRTICLDSSGNRTFAIKFFLHRSTIFVMLAGCILIVLILISGRLVNCLILIAYCAFIAYMTVLERLQGSAALFLTLPQNAYLMLNNNGFIKNIWLFVPLGAIMYKLFHMWEIIAIPIAVTLAIETAQIVFGIGAFELLDLIANTAGGAIGIAGCYVLEPMIHNLLCTTRQTS